LIIEVFSKLLTSFTKVIDQKIDKTIEMGQFGWAMQRHKTLIKLENLLFMGLIPGSIQSVKQEEIWIYRKSV